MEKFKAKTVSGIIWSFIEVFSTQGITFLVGIVLARILSPHEFGLIGMLTFFIAVSDSFVNGGFGNALIRKNNCTTEDYSTVFFFNISVSLLIFFILYFSSPAIAVFFKELELRNILRVFGVIVIIDAFSIVHRTILIKDINFKLQTKISIVASVFSGITALVMAYKGMGVWSLVLLRLLNRLTCTILFWSFVYWRPIMVFSYKSFKELFSFASKLLLSGFLDTAFTNLYFLIIGKYFNAQTLGFYTRAQSLADFPSQGITGVISRVTYPVLSRLQNDPKLLKLKYQQLLRSTVFITFSLMLILAACSESLIITLIGEKWRNSVVFLQLLCFVAMLYPLHALNLNILQVFGRSDLFLRLEILKKIIAVPTIFVGLFFGVKSMILAMLLNSFLSYYINAYWSGKLIGYMIWEQIKELAPSFLFALFVGFLVYSLKFIFVLPFQVMLPVQIFFAFISILFIAEIFKMRDYLFLKALLIEKINNAKLEKA